MADNNMPNNVFMKIMRDICNIPKSKIKLKKVEGKRYEHISKANRG